MSIMLLVACMVTAVEQAEEVPQYHAAFTQCIAHVNAQRASRGLQPLAVDAGLMSQASVHATTMYSRRSMYHSRMSFAGECVAAGYGTPSSVVQGWMNSSGHRAILLGGFSTVGVAGYGGYWCLQTGGAGRGATTTYTNQPRQRRRGLFRRRR